MQSLTSQQFSQANSSHSSSDPHQQLQEYKKNMKIFIKEVQKEYEAAVAKYERQIHNLQQQNKRLKEELNLNNRKGVKDTVQMSLKFDQNMERTISPVGCGRQKTLNFLESGHSKYSTSQRTSKYVAEIEPSDFTINQSRFEANSQMNKMVR